MALASSSIAPPSTTIPYGAGIVAGGGGKRSSSGSIISAPTGATEINSSAPEQKSVTLRGNPTLRGTNSAPAIAPNSRNVTGAATNHTSLETIKNIGVDPSGHSETRRNKVRMGFSQDLWCFPLSTQPYYNLRDMRQPRSCRVARHRLA